MRYFIELSYKGTAYNGWQRQNNASSVQQTIEESLGKLLRQEVSIVGCGRTDTGVHAEISVAHFEFDRSDLDGKDFAYHLNCILPFDISIHRIYKCDLHARFDAVFREYKYYISLEKNPFKTEFSWLITTPLDVVNMQQAADIIKSYRDFGSMCRVGSDNKTTLCEIFEMNWEKTGNMLIFTVSADRFLRGMVRALVGTMVEVGKGKLTPEDMHRIMQAQNRSSAGAAAPAQGLFMTSIKYKEILDK